jgi:hypothetical protein
VKLQTVKTQLDRRLDIIGAATLPSSLPSVQKVCFWGRVVVLATKTILSHLVSILHHPQQLDTSREYMSNWNQKLCHDREQNKKERR